MISRNHRRKTKQTELRFRTWGGKRDNAGRKRHTDELEHIKRPVFRSRMPVHVTMKMDRKVWNLRAQRGFRVVEKALFDGKKRFGGRLVHFSVQHNHIHLLVEADDRRALISFCRGISIRIARRLNALMQRRGRVIGDRYHSHVLQTPTEVRNAIHYIRQNGRKHLAQIGIRLPKGWLDPCSSDSQSIQLLAPLGWLLQVGWQRKNQRHRSAS